MDHTKPRKLGGRFVSLGGQFSPPGDFWQKSRKISIHTWVAWPLWRPVRWFLRIFQKPRNSNFCRKITYNLHHTSHNLSIYIKITRFNSPNLDSLLNLEKLLEFSIPTFLDFWFPSKTPSQPSLVSPSMITT